MFWMGKRKQGHFDLSPLEYMICLILFRHEKQDLGQPGGSRAMSGYDIIAELNTIFEGIWEAQTGTMYPLLNKMASNSKWILHSQVVKSPIGPAKTVYDLTEEAYREIKALLAENFENDVEFMERYLILIAEATDIQEYRPMILKYSEKLLKQLHAKAKSTQAVELRRTTLKKLHEFLENTVKNIKLDLEELEKIPAPPPPTPEANNEEKIICPKCGQETSSSAANFCWSCGKPLPQSQ